MEDIGLPLGRIVKSTTSQEQSIFAMIEECKREGFSGYITIYFYVFGSYYEGNVVFIDGDVKWAVARFDHLYLGNDAFTRILEEASAETCNIDVHELKNAEKVLRTHPSGTVERGEGDEASLKWRLNELRLLRQRLDVWRTDGWDVEPLEEAISLEDIEAIKEEFDTFERNVNTMRDLRERLHLIDAEGFEAEKERIAGTIPDVSRTLVVRKDILELENRLMERRKATRKDTRGDELRRFESMSHYWRSQGYVVDRLDTALNTGNVDIIKTEFNLFERDVASLSSHRKVLQGIESERHAQERQKLIDMSYDPVNLPVLERDIYHLGLKVASEGIEDFEPARRAEGAQSRTARSGLRGGTSGRTLHPSSGKGPRPGNTTAQRRTARANATGRRVAGGDAPEQKPVAPPPGSRVKRLMRSISSGDRGKVPTDVILGDATRSRVEVPHAPEHFRRFTFETFVVDETNRFTRAAAFAVAQSPGRTYNPLFIYSPSGLGKTHLLGAIYNHIASHHPDLRQIFVTSEDFAADVVESIRAGDDAVLTRYEDADVLLVDDIQILAGKESGQDVFFQLFNLLHSQGRQIVITSDRPPKDMRTLEKRLRTRFEGGLIADMQVPSLELRTAILIKKGAEMGSNLQADDIEYIAGNITDSIRELEGAMTKLHAEHMFRKKPIDLASAKRLLRDYIEVDDAEPRKAKPRPRKQKELGPAVPKLTSADSFEWGFSYLLEVIQPDPAYKLFCEGIRTHPGLCISRTNPKQLKHFYDLSNAKVLWLTDIPSGLDTVSSMLEELMEEILNEVDKHERTYVMLDGIEYLVHTHGSDPVINFVRHLKDALSEAEVVLLVPLNPKALGEEDLATLEREMTVRRGE